MRLTPICAASEPAERICEKPKFAILEVCDFNENGEVILTTGVGISPTVSRLADYIILELNHAHPKELAGFTTFTKLKIRLNDVKFLFIKLPTELARLRLKLTLKIIGVVETNHADEVKGFTPVDEVTRKLVKTLLTSWLRN